jgi:hypothetical protein
MKTKLSFAALVLIFYCSATALWAGNAGARPSTIPEILKAGFNSGTFSTSSPTFMENKGQVRGFDGSLHPEVKFEFKQGNTSLFLMERGIAYQFTNVHFPEGYAELLSKRDGKRDLEKMQLLQEQIRTETFRMDMTLLGANANPKITTEGRSEDYINFYNFNVLDVRSFSTITYHDIYPGIDWVIYTKNGQVKYDFVLKPGANPSLIQMRFENQESLVLNKDGGFTVKNSLGSIAEEKPLSYQDGKEVSTDFVLKDNTISFALGTYDHSEKLVIDPALVWSTYYGGIGGENAWECATDAAGNIYLAGVTSSTAGIASGGYQNAFGGGTLDAFLVKFNSSGVRQWATYYGGTGTEYGYACATDGQGNVYLAGITTSSTGIASGGHQNTFAGPPYIDGDAFIVKFDGSGVRQWATYYGGNKGEANSDCATDASGNIYLTGTTGSSVGIASGGYQNTMPSSGGSYLVKFDGNGVRQWGTYYGGEYGAEVFSCTTDATGNVFISGVTLSSTGIASGGYQNTIGSSYYDAFLVKFNSSGVRQWGTYYGGTGDDSGSECVTDAAGNVFLVGYTKSATGIASGGHQNALAGTMDAFLVKFNSSGVRQWGTYYGGAATGNEVGISCIANASGDIYMAGWTPSTTDIASGGIQNSYSNGVADAFLVKFSSSGVRQWGTYYGSNGTDNAYSCAIDASGNIYIAGVTTSSVGIASGGHQNAYGGVSDGFLVKIYDDSYTALNEGAWQKNDIDLFPNPTNGSFEIRSLTPVRIALYNETGQQVREYKNVSPGQSVNVQGLASGSYVAQIISESGSSAKKIIVVSD